jgi:hypothetical protein
MMLAGTVAEVELLFSVTNAPPTGAPLLNVTVPCEVLPPVTLVGFTVTDDRLAGGGGGGGGGNVGGCTVSVAVRVVPPKVAESTTAFVAATDTVLMVKPALAEPAATVTLAGTEAMAAFALDRTMTTPPLGAAPVSATVPCEVLPPVTLVGLSVMDETVGVGGGVGAACAWNRRAAENGPATPAELMARTRHHSRVAGSDAVVNCEAVTL